MPKFVVPIIGTKYRGKPAIDALAVLVAGDEVSLRAEPDNPHDSNAVACYAGGQHIGYVPRGQNAEIADALLRSLAVTAGIAVEPIVDKGAVIAAPKILVLWGDN